MDLGLILHGVFETLAYAVGLAMLRRRPSGLSGTPRIAVAVGAVAGAAVGSKLLWAVQFGSWLVAHAGEPLAWLQGKTIVGGLLGGWIGVEVAKRLEGVRGRTGDLFVEPLLVGMGIGRLGCIAAGEQDHTMGVPSPLPFLTVTGADGLPHHDTAAYEVAWLVALLVALRLAAPRLSTRPAGTTFRWAMAAYFGFRVVIDFLKPPYGAGPAPDPDRWGWLTPIQWAALVGGAYALGQIVRAPAPTLQPDSSPV